MHAFVSIAILLLAVLRLDAALPSHDEIMSQWPFATTQRLLVSIDNKPKSSAVIFGKMQVAIPDLVELGVKEPIAVKAKMGDLVIGKDFTVVGQTQTTDGHTVKLELRCSPKRKQVFGNITITDAEGNARSVIVDTPTAKDGKKR